MTKGLFLLLIPILLLSCSIDKKADIKNTQTLKVIKTSQIQATLDNVGHLIPNPCDTFSIEFSGLYSILDSLPNAYSDSLFIDNYLKELGFVLTSSGHGNWDNGPRIMTLELTKGDCNCKVFKKYFYNDSLADGKYNLRVTEKLVCNADDNAVD